MGNRVKVTKADEIPQAVALAEQCAASVKDASPICPLICEELLLRLLNMGCPVISVSLKGRLFRYIEISAAGERADTFQPAPETEGDAISAQLGDCLLEQ